MPKIKVITDPKTKVAIEVKPGVKPRTAYKCPYTNKIVTGKKRYIAHLIKVRADLKRKRYEKRMRQERDEWWANLQATIKTPAEIAPALLANQERIWELYTANNFRKNIKTKGMPRIIRFELYNLRYSNSVSNSHSAPRNGVRNWGCKELYSNGEPKPKGYPGWTGRIRYTVDRAKHTGYFSSELVSSKIIGLNTGSGGSGSRNEDDLDSYYTSEFELRLYADDWPGIKKHKETQLIMQALSDNRTA